MCIEQKEKMLKARTSPWSDITLYKRRNLLVVSTIAIMISSANLVPTKIDSLGVTLTNIERGYIVFWLGVIISYLMISFILTLSLDYRRMLITYHFDRKLDDSADYDELMEVARIKYFYEHKIIKFARTVTECHVPVFYGVIALLFLAFY